MAVNGRTVFIQPYDRPAHAAPPGPQPLAIGAQGIDVSLGDLRVHRDLYYTLPVQATAADELTAGIVLGDHEYFVLGDNSPVSDDSRTWMEDRLVAENQLVGKLLLVVLPLREGSLVGDIFKFPTSGESGIFDSMSRRKSPRKRGEAGGLQGRADTPASTHIPLVLAVRRSARRSNRSLWPSSWPSCSARSRPRHS